MPRNWVRSWAALVALISLVGMSGCCSFWEKHCAPSANYVPQPVPVCCQPCCPAPAGVAPPAAAQAPPPTWNAPRYYQPVACTCVP
jgi:hypothetical protein